MIKLLLVTILYITISNGYNQDYDWRLPYSDSQSTISTNRNLWMERPKRRSENPIGNVSANPSGSESDDTIPETYILNHKPITEHRYGDLDEGDADKEGRYAEHSTIQVL